VQKVYPSDANFLLVKVADARAAYDHLLDNGIVVRDRSQVELCEGCLRITVGTKKENAELIKNLETFLQK
jgi:histidinol-phosphate aminotransferase